MAKKDAITKNYMRKPDIFADFFNGYIYEGEEVVKSTDLSEVDTSNIAIIPSIKGNKTITIQKYRDIIKQAVLMQSSKSYYLLLGIENQSDIHYAMPVRNMLYDALVYSRQVETITKSNHENELANDSSTFLSGFSKKDKLIPVITVTVYWGSDPWDAPVTLKEMLIDTDDKVSGFINDFNCNLFSIVDIEKLPEYKTELKELFNLLRARNNGYDFQSLISNDSKYNNISKDTAIMMHELAGIKLPRKNKEGNYNMCKAILEIQDESRQLGIEQGIEQGIKQGIEQGVKQGIKQGIEQGQELALNILTYIMHNPNESSEDIAKHFKSETSYVDCLRNAVN